MISNITHHVNYIVSFVSFWSFRSSINWSNWFSKARFSGAGDFEFERKIHCTVLGFSSVLETAFWGKNSMYWDVSLCWRLWAKNSLYFMGFFRYWRLLSFSEKNPCTGIFPVLETFEFEQSKFRHWSATALKNDEYLVIYINLWVFPSTVTTFLFVQQLII